MATIGFQPEFGLIGIVIGVTFFLNLWQMLKISALRKKNGIKYPAMTSDNHQDFNCAQRVHQNTLENIPFFFANLLVAGMRTPMLTAALGVVWIVMRVMFSNGYYTGNPEKRKPGAQISIATIGLLCLLSFYTGLGLLEVF
jgi:glutathione S-transferase